MFTPSQQDATPEGSDIMQTTQASITNRRGQTMYVRYEAPENTARDKLAIIQHGYAGEMDAPHILAIANAFRDAGFSTLCLNATHSFNESDGDVDGNTIETHLHDLEDCIVWARGQDWFTAPFALAGHSLGGYTVLHFAAAHPDEVSLLFPCASVVNGRLLAQAFERNLPDGEFESWRSAGTMTVYENDDSSGQSGQRPFTWLTGMESFDILPRADRLTMPVLMVVGAEDVPTPPDHQLELYGLLPGEKEMHILPGCDHSFTAPEHREKMAAIVREWAGNFAS
jgi:pimeloyl-ACP methyl ester carboxylesterase